LSSNTVSLTSRSQDELFKTRKIPTGNRTEFTFNNCFDKGKTNVYIYNDVVKRIALSSLAGINGTIFMYGQTGSGKTFTMMGPHGHSDCHSHFEPPKSPFVNDGKVSCGPLEAGKGFSNKPKSALSSRSKTPVRNVFNPTSSVSKEKFLTPMETEENCQSAKMTPVAGGNGVFSFPVLKPQNSQISTMPLSLKNNLDGSRDYEINTLKNHSENMEGILSLAMKDIFKEIETNPQKKFFLRASYLEIYNDSVYDLLKSHDRVGEALSINQDANKGFFIRGATEEIVSSIEEVIQKIQKGEANRHYASTTMNHSSSRSHTIFRLYVQSMPAEIDSSHRNYITESLLNFVDLAGSERADVHDKTKVNGKMVAMDPLTPLNMGFSIQKERIKESQRINKSLFFLTQVISLKSQGKPDAVIPYRNSPLTKILRSSLGGNSRTAVILCINPCVSQIEQTMSTLRFGLNAKKIENKVQANIINSASDEMVQELLREYERKIHDLEKEKSHDKNASDKLMKMIQSLQEQKALLSERLQLIKKYEIFPPSMLDLTKVKAQQLKREHLHYGNVGILHVLTTEEEKESKITYDFEGKYALDALRGAKMENKSLNEKLKISEENNEKLGVQNSELNDSLASTKKALKSKKNSIKSMRRFLNRTVNENYRCKEIIQLYLNKNPKNLKKLPLETLEKIEKNLYKLLDEVKLHKSLKVIRKRLPREIEENESFKVFESFMYDASASERDQDPKSNNEDDLDYEDFRLLNDHSNGYKKLKTQTVINVSDSPVIVETTTTDETSNKIAEEKSIEIEVEEEARVEEIKVDEQQKEEQKMALEVSFEVQQPEDKVEEEKIKEVQIQEQQVELPKREGESENSENVENLDTKLAKLRGSYSKIIDMMKTVMPNETRRESLSTQDTSNSFRAGFLTDRTNLSNESINMMKNMKGKENISTIKEKENITTDFLQLLNAQRDKIEKLSTQKFSSK